jgi:RNA-directed DNA polymerase
MSVSNHTVHRGANGAKGSSNSEYRIEPDRTATQSAESRLTGPMRLHQLAKQNRSMRFDNLLHHITPQCLLQAYHHLNKNSAKGVDGESWESYGANILKRIQNLHSRIHTMKYKP